MMALLEATLFVALGVGILVALSWVIRALSRKFQRH